MLASLEALRVGGSEQEPRNKLYTNETSIIKPARIVCLYRRVRFKGGSSGCSSSIGILIIIGVRSPT